MGAFATYQRSYATAELVSAGFPIPLRTESLSGLWVPPPSQGAQLVPAIQAMTFSRLTPVANHIIDNFIGDVAVLSAYLARTRVSSELDGAIELCDRLKRAGNERELAS